MLRSLLAALIALPLIAAGAKPPPKQAPVPAIRHVQDICTPEGGFGRSFATGYGRIDTTVDEDWRPFTKLTIEGSDIRATASFLGIGENAKGDAAAAEAFAEALDKALAAKKTFPHRKASQKHVFFNNGEEPGSGQSFEIHILDSAVLAICTNLED